MPVGPRKSVAEVVENLGAVLDWLSGCDLGQGFGMSLDEADGEPLEFGFLIEADGEEVETIDHRDDVLNAG